MLITTKFNILIKNMQNSNNYCYIKIFLFLKILCHDLNNMLIIMFLWLYSLTLYSSSVTVVLTIGHSFFYLMIFFLVM